MKIKNSIKKICNRCIVVKRQKKIFIICFFKKHKQRQL
ncbi:50S ribosomal protein L36 [Candidatus Carsonella ruddii]|uniref:50S ribosomal protein L36 n=1 Tax=Candidatus Carsonella ruddii (Diaphorina cf. continua) TaxID=2661587 RepID=A0A7R6VZP9_CARRU|nr:50S ribosomal protein L36 [Candidatus Carsonella ruddii (Diaphorina cf. continua)]BCG49378.1 50S ribosomal protein L36 [Candidatus Carsonella ruddii (Diaphorina cf. continua)]